MLADATTVIKHAGDFEIISAANETARLCVSDPNGDQSEYLQLNMAPCQPLGKPAAASQVWTYNSILQTFVNKNSDMCLTTVYGNTKHVTLVQAGCIANYSSGEDAPTQQFVPMADGTLSSLLTECLDISGGFALAQSPLKVLSCNTSKSTQQWSLFGA